MAKKYRYNVGLSTEQNFTGTVDLTKKEAEIVAYATNTKNWKNCCGGSWCGIVHQRRASSTVKSYNYQMKEEAQ